MKKVITQKIYTGHAITRQTLANFTNTGAFEDLVSQILRRSEPLYKSLLQPGTNPKGQSIKGPVDGLTFATDKKGIPCIIVAEHTTISKNKLENKWLDKKTGDLIKAIKELTEYEATHTKTRKIVVLATNQEPAADVIVKVENHCKSNGIEVDIWANSRLADFLDNNVDGQWIRHRFLKIPQVRLSINLANEISANMIEDYKPIFQPNETVPRNIQSIIEDRLFIEDRVLFLSGNSGIGKSVLCYDICSDFLSNGGGVFVLSHEIIENSITLLEAITKSFKAYSPELYERNILTTLANLYDNKTFILWVEDINKGSAPADLVEKLLRWFFNKKSSDTGTEQIRGNSSWLALCPVWPKYIDVHQKSIRESIEKLTVFVETFDSIEGTNAVRKKALKSGLSLSIIEAEKISDSLGRDPLLIGLISDYSNVKPQNVIKNFIEDSINKLEIIKIDASEALNRLMTAMINQKILLPTINDIRSYMTEHQYNNILQPLMRDRNIIAISRQSPQKITFRHDRVRDYLLSETIAKQLLDNSIELSFLSDPYFAKQIGDALSNSHITEQHLSIIIKHAPLALFEGLRDSKTLQPELYKKMVRLCKDYLIEVDWNEKPKSLRFAIEIALLQLDGSEILELLNFLPSSSWPVIQAKAKNGNIRSAATFCYSHEPSVNSPIRDRIIAHAYHRFGDAWVTQLSDLILDKELNEEQLTSALYLAGEISDTRLSGSIYERWKLERSLGNPLTSAMLFSVISCGAGVADFPLNEIIETWKKLPNKVDENNWSNPRYDVGKYGLSGGLKRIGSDRTITPLIEAAKKYEELRQPIYGCLENIDHPLAVEYVCRYVSNIDKEVKKNKGSFNPLGFHFANHWKKEERHSRKLSKLSRDVLKNIWNNPKEHTTDRKRAFELWAAMIARNDLDTLKNSPPKGLEKEVLIARIRHKDHTAKNNLKEKIRSSKNSGYWWQFCRQVNTHGFESEIEICLNKRRKAFQGSHKEKEGNEDWILSELLADRDERWSCLVGQVCGDVKLCYVV